MRRLLLVRHGNTFEDGAPVVRVGSRTDLPLTAKGLAQAATFAAAVRAAGLAVGPFLAGPLARTRMFVTHGFGFEPRLDDRLREIDYGSWEGRTDADIALTAGADTLEAWNRRCVWPEGQGWSPDPGTLEAGAATLVRELAAGDARLVPVLCSSQGILRYFAKLDATWFAAAAADGKLGVATGSCCGIVVDGASVRVAFWNRKPDAATLRDF
ncbi:MAG: histidine phosphatase family protein [Rhodospirillales bacterium]|nr:histidine phosphatase family protein [Rhodospirillales bacterium]